MHFSSHKDYVETTPCADGRPRYSWDDIVCNSSLIRSGLVLSSPVLGVQVFYATEFSDWSGNCQLRPAEATASSFICN